MIKKTVVVIAASALACAFWASTASAKTHHHKAKPTHVAKTEAMKTVPGQNPIAVAPATAPVKGAKAPEAVKGNNAMGVAGK